MSNKDPYAVKKRGYRPPLVSFVVPMIAGFGAFFGLFVGMANGSGFLGLIAGAVIGAALAFVLGRFVDAKWPDVGAGALAGAVGGLLFGGVTGLVIGGVIGAILGRATWWLASGEYRSKLPLYASALQVWWHHTFRLGICGFIFFFLIAPILTIIPL